MHNPIMGRRNTTYSRQTRETHIDLRMDLDGTGQVTVATGFGFGDHMLTLLAFWAGMDLELTCKGDLDVDAHHTLEDCGLCLGETLRQCLEQGAPVARVGWARVPMDEALADVVLDLSGRPYLVWQDNFLPPVIAGEEKDLWREFFKSLANSARMNLHVRFLYGQNGHHLLESACKGLGLALSQAVRPSATSSVFSTKGSLDS